MAEVKNPGWWYLLLVSPQSVESTVLYVSSYQGRLRIFSCRIREGYWNHLFLISTGTGWDDGTGHWVGRWALGTLLGSSGFY